MTICVRIMVGLSSDIMGMCSNRDSIGGSKSGILQYYC